MKGAKESKKRAGLFLGAVFAGLGLLLTFLFQGEQAGEGVETQVLQKEAVSAAKEPAPVGLERLPVVPNTKRVGGAEAPDALVFEREAEKKKTGTILITAHGPKGFDGGFSLALAKIDEARGELRVYARPQIVQSPWESTELSPGLWRVCAFQFIERQEGFPFLLEETSVNVLVREGEAAELGLNFSRDSSSTGALEGTVLFSGVSLQAIREGRRSLRGSRRSPTWNPRRAPKTIVGLWNEQGKLVDMFDVRGGRVENGFQFSQLPRGEHFVGVMWSYEEVFGWPSEERQSVSAPSLELALNAKSMESFSMLALLAKDPVQPLPPKLYVTTVVDGKVLGGEIAIANGDPSFHTPPLEGHELQWLVRAMGYKTELISEERLLFFAEEPSVPLTLKQGRSVAVVAVPCSLAEVLVYDDPAFLLASCGGLEGVELRRRGASLGVTGAAGIITLPSLSRGGLATVRPASSGLLIVSEAGQPLTWKLGELYVMPMASR